MSNSRPPAAAFLDPSVAVQLRQVSTATLTMVLLKRGVRTSWLRGVMPLKPMAGRVVGPAFTIRFVPGREDLSHPESYASRRGRERGGALSSRSRHAGGLPELARFRGAVASADYPLSAREPMALE